MTFDQAIRIAVNTAGVTLAIVAVSFIMGALVLWLASLGGEKR